MATDRKTHREFSHRKMAAISLSIIAVLLALSSFVNIGLHKFRVQSSLAAKDKAIHAGDDPRTIPNPTIVLMGSTDLKKRVPSWKSTPERAAPKLVIGPKCSCACI